MLKVVVNGKVVNGTKVVVQNGDKIVLTDAHSGQSPVKMVTKKVGKSLHVFEEGAQEPSLVLEDYYAQGIPAQVSGIDASGGYVNYAVADTGSMELMSGPLEGTAAATTTAAGTGLSTAAVIGLGALGVGAIAVAASGGGGGDSAPVVVADTTAPVAPTIALATDAGTSATDGITNVGTVNVTGLESGATWQYQIDGGTWTTGTGTTFTASAGAHTYAVRQTDAAGNVSTLSTSLGVTLDTTAPIYLSAAAHSTDKTIVLTYDSPLDTTHIPAATDFAITTGGIVNTVSSVSVSGSTVTLTMTNAFSATSAVTLTYTDASGDTLNGIQDIAGNDGASVTVSSGLVADGYVRGAAIWIDTNKDGTADYDTGVTTDESGNFFLPPGTPSGSIVAIGGVNIDTGVPNTMPLRAPEGSTVINPLTTLVQAIIQADTTGNTSAETASISVVAALGLTAGTDLTTYDPIAESDLSAQKAAATVATIITLAAESATDSTNTIISNIVEQIQASETSTVVLDLSDSTTISNMTAGVTLSAEVESAIADASTSIKNATDLSKITTAQSVALDTIAVSASTITASAITADTTPAIKVNLNITSTDGTAAVVGDTVLLKADGVQIATATLTDLNIAQGYITLNSPTLSEGAHAISAVIVDQAGNISNPYPSVSVTVDTTPITPSAINRVATDNIINLAEKTAGVTLSGTIASGSTNVTVEGNNATVTGTSWSYTLTVDDYTAMGEGAETIDVVVTAANSTTATSTRDITIDTIAPTGLTINAIATNDAINAAEKTPVGGGVGVSVSGTAENNAVVTLTLGAGNIHKVIADGTGAWTYALTAADYTSIGTGTTITATATDAAGNVSTAVSKAIIVDTAAPLLTSFTLTTATDSGTASDGKSNDATPDFTFTAETGATLEMQIGGGSFVSVGTGTGAAQTITAPTTMSEGPNAVTLRATDAAGNVTARTLNYTLDTTVPTVTITEDESSTGNIAGGNITYKFSFSEPVSGFTVDEITVANGTKGTFTAVSSTVYTLVVTPTAGFEGNVTVDVASNVAMDAAANGNTVATQSVQAVDMLAPAITIDPISTDDLINKAEAASGVVSGTTTAENGQVVTVKVNGMAIGTTAVTNGVWSLSSIDGSQLLDGDYVITAEVSDIAGNLTVSASRTMTVDQTVATPTVVLANDTGIAADQITSDASLTLSTPAIDVTRTFTVDGGTAVSSYVAPTADGSHTVLVTDTDTAGNISTASSTFTLDKTAPTVTATITGADDNVPSTATVNIANGTTTNDNTPVLKGTIIGTLGTNEVLAVYEGSTRLGEATLIGTDWSFATTSLANGTHSFTAVVEDLAGNAGTSSTAYGFTVDATVPTALASITSTAQITNDTTPTITGALSAPLISGEVVKVYEGTTYLGDATVTGQTWSFTTAALSEASHSFTATVENLGGNQSQMSSAYSLAIDITAPVTPTVVLANDTGITTDQITNDALLTISTPAIDMTRTFTVDSATATNVYTAPTADGSHTVLLTDTDTAGNISTASLTFTLDKTIAIPTVILTNDTGIATDHVTSDASLTLSTPVLDVTRTFTIDGATAVSTYTAPTADGSHTVLVTDTDTAGNISTASLTFTLDTTAPTGTISNATANNILNAAENVPGTKTITGTSNAEVGSMVVVKIDGNPKGMTTVNADGTWSLTYTTTGSLTDGEHIRSAEITDTAGNVGIVSKTFTVDTVAPVITMNPATADNILNAIENSNTTKMITGTTTAEDGQIVTYKVDGVAKGTGVVSGGAWTVTFAATAPFLSDGTHIRSAEVTDAAGNIAAVSSNFTVDTIAPSIASTNPIVTSDSDVSGTYSAGDTITLRFSESVNTSTLTLSNLLLSTGTWGTSTIQSFDNTSVTIQLAFDAVVAQGATVTISQANIVDIAGNTALADLVYTIPVPADTTPPSALNFYFNEMTNQVYLDMYSIETGATWEYQINGGTWTAGTGNSFVVPEINGEYAVAVRQTDAAGNASILSTDIVTVRDSYTISNATLIAPETAITAFPTGTYTDGYVTIAFTSTTAGTITEPNGTVHNLSLANGIASATVNGTTYTYKMLASDGDMMVLGQTDTDLTVEMNGEVQGPPPVWTLKNTAATADALPTGTTTFYTTDTDNFGDRNGNDWATMAFDFAAKTIQGFDLNGIPFTPETFTVVNNQIIINEPSGNYNATITQIGNANGFYAFSEEYVDTRTWGTNSASGASDMTGYLSSHSDYLWQEYGYDYNKNGTTDDYGKVIRDINGTVIAFEEKYSGMIDITSAALATNALTVNWGSNTETYSVDDNATPTDLYDNQIKVVEAGTHVFSLATANPFSYTSTVDGDTTLPTITSAEVYGNQLKLTFSEPLDNNPQPLFSLMSVMVNGTPVTITSAYPQGNNSVMIYLGGSTVLAADSVTISYSDPSISNDANVVQDTSGNDLATVTNMAVTNVTGLPTIYVSQMNGGVEGTGVDSAITFQVFRSGSDLTAPSSVAWAVSAGTADAADFVGGTLPSGTVAFAANETVQTITIPVVGDWIPEENENFSLTLSNPTNIYLNSFYPVSGTIANDDQIPNALILGSTLSATETPIVEFPAGTTFTDGYVTMVFTSTTAGTITEPNGAVHAISLSGGIATVTIAATATTLEQTYAYKLLTSSTDALVLAQTDLDLTAEMNGYVDGPPPIWTLINSAATVDAIPTTGIVTLYDTTTDNYGDLNGSSDVKITFDFDNQTAQHYAIDGTPTFLESFSVYNNTMIFGDANMKSYVTLMANSAGYYTFKDNYVENQNWGNGSANNTVDISGYLSSTGDILWSENGMDYNGNGTIYDYGMVTRTAGTVDGFTSYTSNVMDHSVQTVDYTAAATLLNTNALEINEGDRIGTYSVASTDTSVLTDNSISVVTKGTDVFTFSQTNPFSISYAYEMDMGNGTVGVGLHDGMALNVATDLGYTDTLFCINSVTDTGINTITISIADVLAQGAFTDLTPQDLTDSIFVNAVGINAGANDILNATGGWIDTNQTVTIKGIDYSVYADNTMAAQLYVSNSITPVL